ncbi:MAG: 50S ribosomal protein L9 [Ardenticatenales bacterium]|nr:50S ribosomal protein L9 [Ardenticatenales bacterium]
MKVLLKEDVENLGYAGEVYAVADGYGRNYLIPRGLAVKASPKVMKQAESWRQRAAARREQQRAEFAALAARISATELAFEAKAGETGKLYGSVTTADVVEALNAALGIDLDRRLVVSEPLRQLGKHHVPVRLSAEFHPTVTVVIREEGAVEADEEAAEETDAEAEVA